MASLLDKLRETQTQRAQTPVGGQTRVLEEALTKKATGRGFASRGPRASGVIERAAVGEQEALATQQQLQGQQAAEASRIQEAGQQQQFAQQVGQLTQSQQEQINQLNRQADTIGKELARKSLSQATEKDLFNLAQLGVAQALQDKQYVDSLQSEGRRKRLDDAISFKQELQNEVFRDQESLIRDQQVFQSMMNASDAQFQKELAKMGIDVSNEIIKNEMKAAETAAKFGAAANVAGAGIQAAASN